ncbi:dihydrolipoamide acetyltransferase component of pyruvate dehydrogenase complex [Paenibacillus marchantiophytorum]|uniref:Dihydrolipoamide acetyltransferase component of pyruvate dehydrogenase complex n=1 Tax=Paenibacillus marchantiophytorum TaxID=1619310 RepID=A0ABQ1ETC5_9BACL|nr:dihydrolipoamide acetyltransferase family protein [Paenibacillus marchantiophytorum]GFZ85632.1 dihydrolipoamide acetyltransferase component of pyruvate dehydrogenase complex [Paenibacillus marchantiophytorum]
MALFEYKFPELGEGIHEGEIVKLLVKAGDTVTDETILMEVQNDKAVVEVPCPVEGKVVAVSVKEGQVCNIGELVMTIEVTGELPAESMHHKSDSHAAPAAAPAAPAAAAPAPAAAPAAAPSAGREVLATPSIRKLAREKGITLAEVTPTGKHGRVTREDVLGFSGAGAAAAPEADPAAVAAAGAAAPAATPQQVVVGDRVEERIPFKGIRKIIANAMVKSVYTAPHVTLMDEIDVSALVALRERTKPLAEKKGVKLTYLPFIVKALVAACRQFPVMNAMIDEEKQEIVYKKYYNIGIATDTENGLLVPVIHDADRKNVWSIASSIKDLAVRGREGKLAPNELKGSTISITNIGSVGGMFFTPVINFPEVAILGAGRITEKPVVKNGQIVAASVMALSLSFDHRIVDGATAQSFLNYIKQLLADPELLVLEV